MSMTGIDLSILPEYLQAQRWFGSKGLPIKDISVIDHIEIFIEGHPVSSLGAFILAIIEVVYELGPRERYQLMVCPEPGGRVSAALDDDEFARELFRIIRQRRSVPSGVGALRGETLPGAQVLLSKLPASPRVRRITEEQSNSSLVFEDKAILKVIRKIEPGLNPEVEMGRFLASQPSFKGAPALLGVIEMEGPTAATLAVLHQYVRAESDGWKYVLAAFRARPTPDAALLKDMARLGKVLAELHLALASAPTDPAFAPETIQQEDLQRWSSSIIGELGVTLGEAEKRIPDLGDLREPLVERVRRLGQIPPSGKKTRVHGDLHLGQVLRVSGDWMIFDFEGEPARSFNQRREKYTPLKDVAGMLRSFAYAQAAVELEGAVAGERSRPCREAFLSAYVDGLKSSDLLPSGEAFRTMLDAFELEKSVYELRYELQSRPDWVRIPIRTLKELGKGP
jgi:trehalose synthase-fused probable maltokinase